MELGHIQRAVAFEVSPRQTQAFNGGTVRISDALTTTLESTFAQSRLSEGPMVDFVVDPHPGSRAHPVRQALMDIGFGAEAAAATAGEQLATRFAAAMDRRSKPALLIASVHQVAGRARDRQIILWTFPQQAVFRLRAASAGTAIDVLDVFSRESKLRKAAMFTGGRSRTDLLSGRVLDFQASDTDRAVADLWIVKFLDARLQMSGDEGTRLLARSLRTAYDKFSDDPEALAQIQAAIVRLRNTSATRVSLNSVASELSPEVASAFRAPQYNSDSMLAAFPLNKDLFDTLVQYRIYTLTNGVWVSAPFGAIGDDVHEESTPDGKRLTATGFVEAERVRSRHG